MNDLLETELETPVTLADDPAGITAAVEAYAAEVAATVAGWLAGEDA